MHVSETLNPEELGVKTAKEIHIQLDPVFTEKKTLEPLRDYLFEASGSCSVFFHIDVHEKPFTVKAASQISVTPDEGVISDLKNQPCVLSVWKE